MTETDPHEDDYCIVCDRGATAEGPMMYPVNGIENVCICGECVEREHDVSMDEYQSLTDRTAIYPDEFPEFVTPGLVYVALGLAEAGEVQEKVKKAIREDDVSYLNDIPAEAGDVLWYLFRVPMELSEIDAVDFDGTLGDIADENLDKLLDRKERDVLEGEGDER